MLALLMAFGCSLCAFAADGKYGDVNGNGSVNSTDALSVLKHAVGLATLPEDAVFWADVNADGKVNSTDALEILQYAVGKITAFTAEIKIPKPSTSAEVLALYAQAVDKARADIPAYKLKQTTKMLDAKVTPTGPIVLMVSKEEIEKMEKDLITEESRSNILRQGTQSALYNLPSKCTVTDPSVFKSVKCTVLANGDYQVDIVFKDASKPGASNPIVKVLGLPDYSTLKAAVEDQEANKIVIPTEDGEDIEIEIDVTLDELKYTNTAISCVISAKTGEFVSLTVTADAYNSSTTDLALMGKLATAQTARTTLEYSNFIY